MSEGYTGLADRDKAVEDLEDKDKMLVWEKIAFRESLFNLAFIYFILVLPDIDLSGRTNEFVE